MIDYSRISEVSCNDTLTKNIILTKVSEYDIFTYYLGFYPKLNEHYKSPFTTEKTPSFIIYQKNGLLRFKCFSSGKQGDAFQFVQYILGLTDFIEVLISICNNLIKNISFKSRIQSEVISSLTDDLLHTFIEVKIQPFTSLDIEYWQQFNISKDILIKYNVASCKEVLVNNKLRCKYSKSNPVYSYFINNRYKIYRPNEIKKNKFVCNTNADKCIQGFNQLEYNTDTIFITSSMKDVMSLYSIGFESIALNSENAFIPETLINYLKSRYKTVLLFYDNDLSGIEAAERFAELYNIGYITTPEKLEDCKDPSDYIKNIGYKELKTYINNAIYGN